MAELPSAEIPYAVGSKLTIPPRPLCLDSFASLANGVRLPMLGFGTSHQGGFSRAAFDAAVEDAGIRLVDTARRYGTEKLIGQAIRESGIERSRFFITTKVWPSDYGYESTLASITSSLNDLDTSYIDLLLMHWPDCPDSSKNKTETMSETWRAFGDAYAAGKLKAIGVSNFNADQINLLNFKGESDFVTPHVNQVEFHPYCQPNDLIQSCLRSGIFVQGYCPFAKGEILHDDRLRAPIEAIAKKHGKTVAQTAIRWCLQRGVGCIPKSTRPSRVVENVDVFDFELDSDDMQKMDGLAKVAYVKATWEPREMSRYQGVISRNIEKFLVHQID